MASRLPHWIFRIAFGLGGILFIVWAGLGWVHANDIRAEFLIARPNLEDFPLTVGSNEAGRIVVPRTPETEQPGVYGVESADGYAQMSTIVRIGDASVERGVQMLDGTMNEGDAVRVDADAYFGDPSVAHGLGFEEPRVPSDIGPHPTWFVDGRRATWILFVHGRGDDRLSESLRVMPSLVEQGFPVLAITYRNDVDAAKSDKEMRYWGLEEWRDVEAAVTLAKRKGAKDFVIVGSGFGASIVSTFLHESLSISDVVGVVYDSPVLNLESVVGRWQAEHGIPKAVGWLGRRLAAVRFGMDWPTLDQMERVEQFDVPMLILYGANDPVTPPEEVEAFAELLGDYAELERFEQGAHGGLWNIDAQRYEAAIATFLLETVGPE